MMIMKFRSMKLPRSFSKLRCGKAKDDNNKVNLQRCNISVEAEVKWELRPGGMLVQKRDSGEKSIEEEVMMVRVVTGSRWHDISIHPTSTFGELKMILSVVTGLEPKEQRLLFKGKEREDEDYLHMVGVRDNDKVLMFQDPTIKERKLATATIMASYRTIITPISSSAFPLSLSPISSFLPFHLNNPPTSSSNQQSSIIFFKPDDKTSLHCTFGDYFLYQAIQLKRSEVNMRSWEEKFQSIEEGAQRQSWRKKFLHAYWKGTWMSLIPIREALIQCNNTK
ncbi:hypothetical protein QVD17_04607 [Tagetes erecta]|uniref:Ubiquitin-like domain-containing protein n=1 Tax=Tagetes erecta TaxID=13708 RepID=A0AAD8PAU4_TARER|nr:hypothetical protein QVD17_04607 [Tagetes erecta]